MPSGLLRSPNGAFIFQKKGNCYFFLLWFSEGRRVLFAGLNKRRDIAGEGDWIGLSRRFSGYLAVYAHIDGFLACLLCFFQMLREIGRFPIQLQLPALYRRRCCGATHSSPAGRMHCSGAKHGLIRGFFAAFAALHMLPPNDYRLIFRVSSGGFSSPRVDSGQAGSAWWKLP